LVSEQILTAEHAENAEKKKRMKNGKQKTGDRRQIFEGNFIQ